MSQGDNGAPKAPLIPRMVPPRPAPRGATASEHPPRSASRPTVSSATAPPSSGVLPTALPLPAGATNAGAEAYVAEADPAPVAVADVPEPSLPIAEAQAEKPEGATPPPPTSAGAEEGPPPPEDAAAESHERVDEVDRMPADTGVDREEAGRDERGHGTLAIYESLGVFHRHLASERVAPPSSPIPEAEAEKPEGAESTPPPLSEDARTTATDPDERLDEVDRTAADTVPPPSLPEVPPTGVEPDGAVPPIAASPVQEEHV